MTETAELVMQVFLTIFAGVCVYVLGQILMKFVIDPVHEQRKIIGRISDFLIYHSNRYTNPGIDGNIMPPGTEAHTKRREELLETKTQSRLLASELMVRSQAIPLYRHLECLRCVPSRRQIREAQSQLFYLSNTVFDRGNAFRNHEAAEKVQKALGIDDAFEIDRPKQDNCD